MVKLIGGALIGLMTIVIGLYIASLYFMESRHGTNSPLLIGIGAVFIAVGVFAFIKGFLVMKAEKALAEDATILIQPENAATNGGEVLRKGNQALHDWNAVNEQRDKLKMLEAAGAAEESS